MPTSNPAALVYPSRVPAHYRSRIDGADPQDPLHLQTIPQTAELCFDPREMSDPIGDDRHSPCPHLVHRYPDRVLLIPTHACAIHCRYCFRKEKLASSPKAFPFSDLLPAFDYIRKHTEITEVILTGGDPLLLPDKTLGLLRSTVEDIPHLRALRIHTRMPIVSPKRITPRLVRALSGKLLVTFVTHANHVRELCAETKTAAELLRRAAFVLLNQTVLLKRVNDDADTLATLFQELFYSHGIKPYYLHHCDLTRGLLHFRTSIDCGLRIMETLRGRLSGVCLPQYVLDLPGGHGKIPLCPPYIHARKGFAWTFRSPTGVLCDYEEVIPENPP